MDRFVRVDIEFKFVDVDIETAKEWYQTTSENGDEDAKAALGRLGA